MEKDWEGRKCGQYGTTSYESSMWVGVGVEVGVS